MIFIKNRNMYFSNKILLSFFIILSLNLYSQKLPNKVIFELGIEQTIKKRSSTLEQVISSDENGIYIIKSETQGVHLYIGDEDVAGKFRLTLEHFDKELILIKSKVLDFQKEKKNIEFIFQLNNKIYLFVSETNKKEEKVILSQYEIDKSTFEISEEVKQVAEYSIEGLNKLDPGDFNHSISNDSSKVLIYYNFPNKDDEKNQYMLYIYDNQFNLINKEHLITPYIKKVLTVENVKIDNKGDVHILARNYSDDKEDRTKYSPNHQYLLFSYLSSNKKTIENRLSLNNKIVTEFDFILDNNDNIICAGFYSEEDIYSIKGLFITKIDGATNTIKVEKVHEFDLEFITKDISQREREKKEKQQEKDKNIEMENYFLDHILLKDDGGIIIIGENFSTRIRFTSTPNGGTTSETVYFHNNIIITSLSAEGNVEWHQKIKKNQATANTVESSSYGLAKINNTLYFIFNAMQGENNKLIYNHSNYYKKSILAIIGIDDKGIISEDKLFGFEESNVLMKPRLGKQISDNEFLLFGKIKKIHRFAKVTFH